MSSSISGVVEIVAPEANIEELVHRVLKHGTTELVSNVVDACVPSKLDPSVSGEAGECLASRNASDVDLANLAPATSNCALFAVEDDGADESSPVDDIEASTSDHQCSKIAEIVEQSGSYVSDETGEIRNLSDDEELRSRAWTVTEKEAIPMPAENDGEFITSGYVRQRLKHVFILSAAGKPIYSRYGNEEELSSLMGVMQALVSFASRTGVDQLKSIKAGAWTFVFLHRWPLILVAASRSSESYAQLKQLLLAVHHQICFLLTSTDVTRLFDNRNNFDLRRSLSGSEGLFRSLINLTESNASLFLNAVKVHPMDAAVRTAVGQAVAHYATATKAHKHLVFAVVIANNQLVTIARMKQYAMQPSDLHLIINLVAANPSFKNVESSWSPVCLPEFDQTGFLQAHISYLSDDCPACLLLLTVERPVFAALSDLKHKIVKKLDKTKVLPLLAECLHKRQHFRMNETGVTDLWHFLYKSQSGQFTCPAFDPPYNEPASQQRLFASYLKVHHRMHTSGQSLRILFISGGLEAVLGWVGSTFELYAVFSPLTSKSSAIAKVDKLIEWLKAEEKQLFILNPPLY